MWQYKSLLQLWCNLPPYIVVISTYFEICERYSNLNCGDYNFGQTIKQIISGFKVFIHCSNCFLYMWLIRPQMCLLLLLLKDWGAFFCHLSFCNLGCNFIAVMLWPTIWALLFLPICFWNFVVERGAWFTCVLILSVWGFCVCHLIKTSMLPHPFAKPEFQFISGNLTWLKRAIESGLIEPPI